MSDIVDELFDSVSMILNKKLESLQYNKTILCTVVNADKAKDGVYLVNDGSTNFEAYSTDKEGTYRDGDTVHVLVPNADYNEKKFIVGKDVLENSTPFTYVDPFDKYFDLTGNLLGAESNNEFGLLANGYVEAKGDKTKLVIPITTLNLGDGIKVGYTRLGIKADFKTLIPLAISGNYGLIFKLYVREKQDSTSEQYKMETYYITLDSADMYGNPYNFETYFNQSQVYDIANKGDITSVEISFYQENNFYIGKNTNLLENRLEHQYQDVNGNWVDLPSNLFVKNIYMSLGCEAGNKEDLLLYTIDGESFSSKADIERNKKRINMRWSHLLDDPQQQCVAIHSDEIANKYIDAERYDIKYHWYRYDKAKKDELAGNFWGEIAWQDANNHFNYVLNPDTNLNFEYIKAIIEIVDKPRLESENAKYEATKQEYTEQLALFDNEIAGIRSRIESLKLLDSSADGPTGAMQSDILIQEKKVEELLKEREQTQKKMDRLQLEAAACFTYIHSNVLKFTNSEYKKDPETIDYISGGVLEVKDKTHGIYRMYDGLTNALVSNAEAARRRDLVLTFNTYAFNNPQNADIQKIIWYIPKRNTMIMPPEKGKDYILTSSQEVQDTDNFTLFDDKSNPDYYIITRLRPTLNSNKEIPNSPYGLHECELKQTFRIKRQLLQSASNNIVKVEVVRNNELYGPYTKELVFGPTGVQGTDNTLILSLGSEYGPISYIYHSTMPQFEDTINYNLRRSSDPNLIDLYYDESYEYRWSVDGNQYGTPGDIALLKNHGDNLLIADGWEEVLAVNGGLFYPWDGQYYANGLEKSRGVNNQSIDMSAVLAYNEAMTLGCTYDGQLVFAKQSDIINNLDGYYGAVTGMAVLLYGENCSYGHKEFRGQWTTRSGRTILGVAADGHYMSYSFAGVTGETGLTGPEVQQKCKELGFYNAIMLDGGGSVCRRYYGNTLIDTSRAIKNTVHLYRKKKKVIPPPTPDPKPEPEKPVLSGDRYIVVPTQSPMETISLNGFYDTADEVLLFSKHFTNPVVIDSAYCDVDVCKRESWENYAQPEVIFRVRDNNGNIIKDSEVILQPGTGADIQKNGRIAKAVKLQAGTVEIVSKGYPGEGRDVTVVNNGLVKYYVIYNNLNNSFGQYDNIKEAMRDLNNHYYNKYYYNEDKKAYIFEETVALGKEVNPSENQQLLTSTSYIMDLSQEFSWNQTYYNRLEDGSYSEVNLVNSEGEVVWKPYTYYIKNEVNLLELAPIAWTNDNLESYIELKADLYNADDEKVNDLILSKKWSIVYNDNEFTINNNKLKTKLNSLSRGCILKCDIKVSKPIKQYEKAKKFEPNSDVVYYYQQAVKDKETKEYIEVLNPSELEWNKPGKEYYIIVSDNTAVEYTGYLVVPLRDKRKYQNYNGADRIIYNKSNGGSPVYYKDEYSIDNLELSCGLVNFYGNDGNIVTVEEDKRDKVYSYMPYIKGLKLYPSNMYLHDVNYDVWVNLYDKEGTVAWSQPILILQNQWTSSVLNKWDGSLQVNKEEGTILSTMVGAGKKEKDNTFSGVLMGDVSSGIKDNVGTLGIYGYNEGEQSFGVDVNGQAFLGKSSQAQIKFNGTTGDIQNAGYLNGTGIRMHMDGNSTEAQYLSLQSGKVEYIKLSTQPNYLTIKNSKEENMLVVGDDKVTFAGWDVSKDTLTSTNGKTTLNSNGKITCDELEANGSGKIGGWNISSTTLTGGGTILDSGGTITCNNLIAKNTGTIGNFTINKGSLSGGTISGGYIYGGKINIDEGSFTVNTGGKVFAYTKGLNVGADGIACEGGVATGELHVNGNIYTDPFTVGQSYSNGLTYVHDLEYNAEGGYIRVNRKVISVDKGLITHVKDTMGQNVYIPIK